jgi:uncharacterized membrane protein
MGLIVGALIGGAYHGELALLGALLGFAAGLWIGRWRKGMTLRLASLEAQVQTLRGEFAASLSRAAPSVTAPASATSPAATPSRVFETPDVAAETVPAETAALTVEPVAAPTTVAADARATLPVRKGGRGVRAAPAGTVGGMQPPDRAPPASGASARPAWLAWVLGGNTLARLGVLLLFIGVGFLVKYAADHVRVPIELRLAGVALGAVALLVVGWRLRLNRPGYAMILQGGGVGVLYLTVFGAMRLYGLLPPSLAFALLFAIAGLSAWLAIRQDAIALAAIGIAGGFLAPILASSGSGNHVVLFAYYALLNAAILGIAWFKAWRSLNLLGFLFTFVIATVWGVTRYRPEHFATTEPFLILFFLFYVAIAVLYALRRSLEVRAYVDATLVFGTPLVAAGLQAGLVRDTPYGMALSALAAAAVYLVLARILYTRRQESLRLIVESFLALGVIFASLAIPLALDARWTSAAWALEGAAMLWVGVRQGRLPVRVFGLLLELGAGVAFVTGVRAWHALAPDHVWPLLNSDCIGALIVALSGLFSAALLRRARAELKPAESILPALLLAWGMLWWLGGGVREIDRFLPAVFVPAASVAFLAATGVLLELAYRRDGWTGWRVPALLLLPALLAIAVAGVLDSWRLQFAWRAQLLAYGGWIAWPFAVAVIVWQLRTIDTRPPEPDVPSGLVDLLHAGVLWLVTLLLAQEFSWLGTRVGDGLGIWAHVPWGVMPALALLIVTSRKYDAAWPIAAHPRAYRVIGAGVLAVVLVLWSLLANVAGDGDPQPLPYMPLLNPLDLTQALVIGALASAWLALRREASTAALARDPTVPLAVLALLGFVWIDALALRTIHFWYDVPYTAHALWHSRLVQAVLSLLWTLAAMAAMVVGNRRGWRLAWLAGAVLLGVVVVKLFMVDLAQVGGVERIVSFIGVGLLLLLIGYLAPVPPRRTESAS